MEKKKHNYWFAAKSYGFGWALPVNWQGWLTVLGYFVLIFAAVAAAPTPKSQLLSIAAATIALVAIVIWKGERPAMWRWGRR